MKEISVPKLINAGIYDAATVHKHCVDTPPRKVSVFEIELPLEDGGCSHINNNKYPVRADHIICAKPGQLRHTRLPFQCYFVHLMVEEGTLYDYLSAVPDYFLATDRAAYQELFEDIIKASSFPFEGSDLYLAGKIYVLIYKLYKEHKQAQITISTERDFINEAITFMNQHYTENPRLEDVADAVNISPIYFQRIFSKAMGRSPYDYLLSKKLDAAKKLLLTTNMPLSAIALQSGFSSQSYFGYVFKRELGITPLSYRKKAHSNYPV